MNTKLVQIFDEAIDLELNVANLYMVFCNKFHEDKDFWWKLVIEEKNHASLLKTGKKMLVFTEEIPSELVPQTLEILLETNNQIISLINEFKKNPPTRKKSFEIAIKLENSAGELHYQKAITKNTQGSEILNIFKKLNRDDKDHASRILDYMNNINF